MGIEIHKAALKAAPICVLAVTGLFATALSACNPIYAPAPKASQTEKPAGGLFFRIQANYELVETGEPLNFDFIVRCNGVFPTTLFKATTTGAAVAISPPEHYCFRALNGFGIERPVDRMKMPLLSWYDSVDDLSLGFYYMTNDAYTSPHAKVRFKSYDVTPASSEDFKTWIERAKADYTQIGAIPGPFGCGTANMLSTETHSCSHADNIARNSGRQFSIADDGVSEMHQVVVPMKTENLEAMMDFLELGPTDRFYCPGYWYFENGEKKKNKIAKARDDGQLPSEVSEFFRENHSMLNRKKNKGELIYLSPDCLLNPELKCDILRVYPLVFAKIDDEGVGISLIDDRYLGLAIVGDRDRYPEGVLPNLTEFDPEHDRDNSGNRYVNDQFACVEANSSVQAVFDFKTQEYIGSGRY